ncbi:MAG: heavy metal-associated domain-containing protein [Candidatus Methanomethylophilaceae archaeon]|nr:heavy metal-associated domain-containing protein [Candidatus Methanomethylophilaceae archaeon]
MKEELAIRVEGMRCGCCSLKIESALRSLPGITFVKVDLIKKEARVVLDTTVIDPAKVLERIEKLGYHTGECQKT